MRKAVAISFEATSSLTDERDKNIESILNITTILIPRR
jgi:hypothetical protein